MNWFRNFMAGRYGTDHLNITMLIAVLVLYTLNFFLQSRVIVLVCWGVLAYYMFRSFSRDITKRSVENANFLHRMKPVTDWWKKSSYQRKDKKTHKYYKCPNCAQKIRVPKGKGKISITCPKCRMEFIKKT